MRNPSMNTQFNAQRLPSKRNQTNSSIYDGIFISLIPILTNASGIIPGGAGRLTSIAILLFFIFKNIVFVSTISQIKRATINRYFSEFFSFRNKAPIYTLLMIFLVLVGSIRGFYNNITGFLTIIDLPLTYMAVFFAIFAAFAPYEREEEKRNIYIGLVACIPVYIFVNIILAAVGVTSTSADIDSNGANKILSIIGITTTRVNFKLGGGLNNFGVMAGTATTIGLMLLIKSTDKTTRLFGLISAAFGIAGISLSDTRAALISSIICILLALIPGKKFKSNILSNIVYALPFLPIIVVISLPTIENSWIADFLRRDGDFAARIGIASGRDIVWKSVFQVLLNFDPIQIIGYGMHGQYISGASKEFSWLFGERLGFSGKTSHNSFLQYLLDFGYIGVLIWLNWIKKILVATDHNLIAKDNAARDFSSAFYAATLFIIFGGLTEAAGTHYRPDSFIFLIMISGAYGFTAKNKDQK
jgi:hypothetical protein